MKAETYNNGKPCRVHPENVSGCVRYSHGGCVQGYRERHARDYDKILKASREWKQRNRKKHSNYATAYDKRKRITDVQYKLKTNLRTRLLLALKGNFKSGSAVRLAGCSMEQLK